MAEGGVHAVVVLRRDQLQRILARSARRRRGAIRSAACNRASRRRSGTCRRACRNCLRRRAGRARCPGATFSRTECSRSRRSSVMPSRKGCGESSSVRIMSSSVSREAGVVEAHAQRPAGGKSRRCSCVSPGAGSAGRASLQVVVAVGEVEIGVLQERGHGQQDIGVIGGVGLELLQHDGEEVFAAQAAHHGVLIGRDGAPGWSCRPPSPSRADRSSVVSACPSWRHVDDARLAAERAAAAGRRAPDRRD